MNSIVASMQARILHSCSILKQFLVQRNALPGRLGNEPQLVLAAEAVHPVPARLRLAAREVEQVVHLTTPLAGFRKAAFQLSCGVDRTSCGHALLQKPCNAVWVCWCLVQTRQRSVIHQFQSTARH